MGDNIITTAVACWGAVLSTYVFISQLLGNRPKVKVNYKNYLEDGTEPIRDIYAICAINERDKPITMAYAYIEQYPPVKVGILPIESRTRRQTFIDGKQIFYHQSATAEFEFPYDFKLIFTQKDLAFGEKKQVIGVFVDQAEHVYKSRKPFWVG
jgi:hypothetical protein